MISFILCACSQPPPFNPRVDRKNFKVELPFELSSRGMIIESFWGAGKVRHRLLWDNHSPTWVNRNVITNNNSIRKLDAYSYRTSTADGQRIQGEVYTCDKLYLGYLTLSDVNMYLLESRNHGVIGHDIIQHGIWKINTSNQVLVFTSDLDSLGNIGDAEILPTTFTNKGISLKVVFGREKLSKTAFIDLGFNGGILLPATDFEEASGDNPHRAVDTLRFSTPANSETVKFIHSVDSFRIGSLAFSTIISTSENVTESLVGLGFFSQFKYVILDYLEKKVYIARK